MIAVFGHHEFGAVTRLLLMGVAVGAVVLIPALGMGLSFPLLADLAARRDAARAADVGTAYALNTLGSIAGAVITGFVLVVALGSETTLRIGLMINGGAALALAAYAARGVAEGSAEHHALRRRVLGAGALAGIALGVAVAAPKWSTRLIDLGSTIYAREPMDATQRQAFLSHRGSRLLAFREGRNATVSVWEGLSGRSLRVNGKVDASDHGDMNTQVLVGLAPAAARPNPASALVVGFGSGVTSRILADVPGMRRVRVVEIEPAVLQMGSFFAGVNGSGNVFNHFENTAEDCGDPQNHCLRRIPSTLRPAGSGPCSPSTARSSHPSRSFARGAATTARSRSSTTMSRCRRSASTRSTWWTSTIRTGTRRKTR